MINEDYDQEDEVYVGVAMSKPGKHTYVIRYEDKNSETANSSNLNLVPQNTSIDSLGKQLIQADCQSEDSNKNIRYSLHRCII